MVGLGDQIACEDEPEGNWLAVYPVVQARNLFVKMVKFGRGFSEIELGCGNLLFIS